MEIAAILRLPQCRLSSVAPDRPVRKGVPAGHEEWAHRRADCRPRSGARGTLARGMPLTAISRRRHRGNDQTLFASQYTPLGGLPPKTPGCRRGCRRTRFRVTAITSLLEQGVPMEDVQHLAGHADPGTTRLYDRRRKKITRNIVERISI